MKKLIDQFIKTIKKDNQYYTFCTKWDNPTKPNFPNHRVGVGNTKQKSVDEFMKHEAKRQKLLEKIKGGS